MELNQVLEKMIDFEKLVEPQEMVILSGHIGGFITDYEMQYDEAKLAFSLRWEEVKYKDGGISREKPLSDKVTEVKMMQDPTYRNLLKIKRTLSELKRYRSDLNRKIDVIMGIRRRS